MPHAEPPGDAPLRPSFVPPPPGGLPAWTVEELPAPPPFSLRNVFQVIGPGAILAATAIGGGEWLVGPATAVRYGVEILSIATIAIAFQVVFNLEAIRYTLFSGEPVFGAFLRQRPGPRFWAGVYAVLAFVHLGWPALALSSAGTIFSLVFGRIPGAEPFDAGLMHALASGVVILTALVLLFGGTIERTLERVSWAMLILIFAFLIVVNLLFVPAAHWWTTIRGFFSFKAPAAGADWTLLGALAVSAGSGGLGNLTISNWFRDKGFGMAAKVGAIEGAVGGRRTSLSPVGRIFAPTPENLARWRLWWRYVHIDQLLVWALFCFVGLFLTTNLATGIVPPGTNLEGLATGTYQAEHLAKFWRGLFYLTLLNGFWILYSTQLGNTDLLVRTITDVLWMGSPGVRRLADGRASRVYYAALALLSLWSFVMVRAAGPFALFKILANLGGALLVLAGIQMLIMNRRLLPRELRASSLRQLLLLGAVLFYGFFAVRATAHWLF